MKQYGTPIEAALVRGFRVKNPRTPEYVGGVQLLSDHHKCLLFRAVRVGLSLPFGFYNLAPAGDPGRGPLRVKMEVGAILNVRHDRRRGEPITGVAECVDRTLPTYDRVRLIQSTKNRSRKNVALYVPVRYDIGNVEWLDHKVTWDRVIHTGTHEARSTLFVDILGIDGKRLPKPVLVGVGHAPQIDRRNPANTRPAREEWVAKIAERLKDEERFVFLSDPNALGNELASALNAA